MAEVCSISVVRRILIYLCLTTSCHSYIINSGSPAQSSMGIASLFTKGTHYDVGFEVGRTFKQYISQYYKEHPELKSVWIPWSHTPQGQKIVDGFFNAAKMHFPQYMKELMGMAHGANIPFREVFLINHGVELSLLTSNKTRHQAESCTDLLVNHPENEAVIIGHNEDNTPLIQNRTYIVTATIIEDGQFLEQFTAYCYPGLLPGNAFGFNSNGVITSVNGLYPNFLLKGKVGRSFVNRAMLVSRNLQDALSKANTPGSYGFSCNIGIMGQSSSSQPSMYNIEVAPDQRRQETKVSLLEVLPSAGPLHYRAMQNTSHGNYFHVNIYRRFVVSQIPDHTTSSIHRTSRIKQYPAPVTAEDVKVILSDTEDPEYPIYRTPRSTDNEATLATVLFDLHQCIMSVYIDRPSQSPAPLFDMDIPCFH